MCAAHSDNRDKNEKPQRRVTMKDIARELGISHVSVSYALRNASGVSEETRRRVKAKAEEMGYVSDPLLSVLSHYRMNSKTKPLHAEIAWVNTWRAPEKLRQHREFDLYWEGALASANRAGFKLQEFNTAEIPLHRLQSIFKARNIRGVLLAPLEDSNQDWSAYTWADFATVRFGRTIPEPETYFVSSAQVNNTILAFNQMHELGYERIGYAGEWVRYRYFGIGFSWVQQQLPANLRLPLLSLDAVNHPAKTEAAINRWIQKNKPDAILTDVPAMPQILKNLGYRVPDDIGLATTSIQDTTIDAGIDQMPYDIGSAAVRTLIALLSNHIRGVPETRNETLIGGKWIHGSMLPPRK